MRRTIIWLLSFFLIFSNIIYTNAEDLSINDEEEHIYNEEGSTDQENETLAEVEQPDTADDIEDEAINKTEEVPDNNEDTADLVSEEDFFNSDESEAADNTENQIETDVVNSSEFPEDTDPTADDDPETATEETAPEYPDTDLSYRAHVANIGWQSYVRDTETAGTTGKGLRMEALQVELPEELRDLGNIYVQTHVQNIDWMTAAGSGEIAGTVGQAKQIEAIRIYLSKELSEQYDVWYRAHTAKYGWLGWTNNGGIAGTVGYGYEIQAIVIDLVKKGEGNYRSGTAYYAKTAIVEEMKIQAHVQNIGWQKEVNAGQTAGTTGQSKRIEAVRITLPVELLAKGNIKVQAHVQNRGWMTSVGSGSSAGTTGKNLRLEAFRIYLTGELAEEYDIWYRAHSANVGWLGWTKNGEVAGTLGYNRAVEALQVDLLPKNSSKYTETTSYRATSPIVKEITIAGHVQNIGWMAAVGNDEIVGVTGQSKRLEAFRLTLPLDLLELGNVSLQAHVQNLGWTTARQSDERVGTEGKNLRMEALKISLNGELANQYDIFYRVHISGTGWLGWAKNGVNAGSTGWSKAIEALQICIAPKGSDPYNTGDSYLSPPVQIIPAYYTQTDSRWASVKYGAWTMYSSGCVPTSLAMIFSGLSGKTVLPTDVATWLYNNTNDFNRREIGGCGQCAPKSAAAWGFKCKGLGSAAAVQSELALGRPVIAAMGPGLFASSGSTHAIVLFRYSAGKTYVYDSWTSSRNGWYNVNTLFTQRSTDPADNEGGYTFYSIYK